MKIIVAIVASTVAIGSAAPAFAQSANYVNQNHAVYRTYAGQTKTGVAANGRCGAISYGTGARSCGTATGGPVGGLGSRN